MKINIEIDTTADEMRRFFGLPDVTRIQSELIEQVRERMQAGVEGYDPLTLLKPFLPEHLRSMDAFQKAFWDHVTPDAKQSD